MDQLFYIMVRPTSYRNCFSFLIFFKFLVKQYLSRYNTRPGREIRRIDFLELPIQDIYLINSEGRYFTRHQTYLDGVRLTNDDSEEDEE